MSMLVGMVLAFAALAYVLYPLLRETGERGAPSADSSPTTQPGRSCPACGASSGSGAAICPNCGAELPA